MSEHYVVILRCTNCRDEWSEVIPEGEVVSGWEASCPYCGFKGKVDSWSVFDKAHIICKGRPGLLSREVGL